MHKRNLSSKSTGSTHAFKSYRGTQIVGRLRYQKNYEAWSASERHKSWVTDHDCSPRGTSFPATHCCRLPSGRDHFGAGFAMGMGTTCLPLMGPSTGS